MNTKPRFKKKKWKVLEIKIIISGATIEKGPSAFPSNLKSFIEVLNHASSLDRTLLKPKLLLGFVNPHANLFTVGKSLFGHYISIILVKILVTKVITYRLPALKASYGQFPLQFFEKYCHISHRWSTTQRHGWCNPSNTYWYFWAETLINGFLHYKNNRR